MRSLLPSVRRKSVSPIRSRRRTFDSSGTFKSNTVRCSCRTMSSPERPYSIDRKSTRLNSSHSSISYAVFCLKKKKNNFIHFVLQKKKKQKQIKQKISTQK